MADVYLITGFLGAGKTTFLREMAQSFLDRQVAVIVNDFGRERVDATLLSGRGFALSEVNNGSIFCACREGQFRDALLETLAMKPDVVLIEASGLSDPTTMAELMREAPFAGEHYVGAICLVDAARFHKVLATAAVCRRQLAMASGVVINRKDEASAELLAEIRRTVAEICPAAPVLETTYGRLTPDWLATMSHPLGTGGAPVFRVKDVTLQKLTLELSDGLRQCELEQLLRLFIDDTYRVKGFATTEKGTVLVDCVGAWLKVAQWQGSVVDQNRLTVLYDNTLSTRTTMRRVLTRYRTCKILTE